MKITIVATIILIFSHTLLSVDIPEGQPKQIESIVQYDPSLDDPFFKTDQWSYSDFVIKTDNDRFEDGETGKILREKDVPRFKHTAKCISSCRGDHLIKYCDAKLLPDGSIELFFHEDSPAYYDKLLIVIKSNKFTSQYWTVHIAMSVGEVDEPIWITKNQTLLLDKAKYNKGDIIKGKFEFECFENNINPKYNEKSITITVSGVFKTIIK
jgi:hypothetical protein